VIVASQVKDEDGRLMNDFTGRVKREEWKPPAGFQRTLTAALDPAQYQLDMEYMKEHRSEDLYSTFNILMRRKPKVRPRCSPLGLFQM
jgi:intron-binding protein aquarius